MFEVIRDALIWLMSWVLDKPPQGGEAFRLLFLIGFSVFATWLSMYWRDLAYRSRTIRRRLKPEERYAGRYFQAVWQKGDLRYAFVNIFFDWRARRYKAAGRAYGADGAELASFSSSYVRFPSEKDSEIEFMWKSNSGVSGYTRLGIEDSDEDLIQGDGLVVHIDGEICSYQMKFKHMHDRYVREALGVAVPKDSSQEPNFVRLFNVRYGPAVRSGFAGAPKSEPEPAIPA
ncbi:hypothetical protein JDN40_06705 [Rhodomicrobium vannielii ATCC 17100]|uniref:hypothetical protein n=1 Tax=Rhodomicrobium vannielii TaxID=1069 RepID=UPI001919E4BD|nr:hypothetical protein [Rhodomicrobium vannielii]MBJ7533790.1 hypothetical protein [Rhodomicrobium vannielii ATCC 17100]